jgi:hypothetical protein
VVEALSDYVYLTLRGVAMPEGCRITRALNNTAALTPNPTHLRNWTLRGIFGVVAGFFLADRTH